METRKRLAPHESFELHELLTFKNVCAAKSVAMGKLVADEELKKLLQQDFRMGQEHIKELQSLIQASDFDPIRTTEISAEEGSTVRH
ncbi:spore coat protein [Bacillota bacterium LX-D]|nr:spore coat protein [Bacillota bacterium LX-D]